MHHNEPGLKSKRETRAHPSGLLAQVLAAPFAFACILLCELLLHTPHVLEWSSSAYLASLAMRGAIALAAIMLVIAFVPVPTVKPLVENRSSAARSLIIAVREQRWILLCIAAATAEPSIRTAMFLTSGSFVSETVWKLPLTLLFALLLWPLYPALWVWFSLAPKRKGRDLRSRFLEWTLWLSAAAALSGPSLLIAGSTAMAAYQQLGRFLTPLVAFTASSVLAALLGTTISGRIALATAALGVFAFGGLTPDAQRAMGRTAALQRSLFAVHADLLLRTGPPALPGIQVATRSHDACAGGSQPPSPLALSVPISERSVILISVDALRSDAIDWRMHAKPVAGNLRDWSEAAVRFPNAVTPFPRTRMALASVGFGVQPLIAAAAGPEVPDVFQLTQDRLPNRVMIAGRYFADTYPFETYRADIIDDAAAQTSAFIAALERLEGKPTLAWLHYFEPHEPYEIHEGFSFGQTTKERYASEVAYVDAQIGRLLEYLQRAGWTDRSLLILFADHGESLGDAGATGHWTTTHPSSLRIPLWYAYPGSVPTSHESMASLRDIAPTILDFLQLDEPVQMSGMSLFRQGSEARLIEIIETFGSAGPLKARGLAGASLADLQETLDATAHGSALFQSALVVASPTDWYRTYRLSGASQLYRYTEDPNEERDLLLADPSSAAPMRAVIAEYMQSYAHDVYCAWAAR